MAQNICQSPNHSRGRERERESEGGGVGWGWGGGGMCKGVCVKGGVEIVCVCGGGGG